MRQVQEEGMGKRNMGRKIFLFLAGLPYLFLYNRGVAIPGGWYIKKTSEGRAGGLKSMAGSLLGIRLFQFFTKSFSDS